MDKGQTSRHTKSEIDLLKKTFGGESYELYALRNLLWQFPLTEKDKKHLNFKPEVLKLLKQLLLPKNHSEIPISHVTNQQNLWMNLNYIKDFSPQGANYHFEAHDILIRFVEQQFHQLVTGTESKDIILEELPLETGSIREEQRFINMMAYHKICTYLTGRINEIFTFANTPDELTPEQQKAKELANSTE
jgi:hypothetical protein